MERDDGNRGIGEGGEFREHGREGMYQREGSDLEDRDEIRVRGQEEEIRAGVREREAERVDVRKSVRTKRERIPKPKSREEASVGRMAVNDTAPGRTDED